MVTFPSRKCQPLRKVLPQVAAGESRFSEPPDIQGCVYRSSLMSAGRRRRHGASKPGT